MKRLLLASSLFIFTTNAQAQDKLNYSCAFFNTPNFITAPSVFTFGIHSGSATLFPSTLIPPSDYIGSLVTFGSGLKEITAELGGVSRKLNHALSGFVTKRRVSGRNRWGLCHVESGVSFQEQTDPNTISTSNISTASVGSQSPLSGGKITCEDLAVASNKSIVLNHGHGTIPLQSNLTYVCNLWFSAADGR